MKSIIITSNVPTNSTPRVKEASGVRNSVSTGVQTTTEYDASVELIETADTKVTPAFKGNLKVTAKSIVPNNDDNNQAKENDKGAEQAVSAQAKDNEPQVHVNLWKLRTGKVRNTMRYYLDIGIKTTFDRNHLKLFLPYNLVKGEEWSDLGKLVSENNTLLCALFNDVLTAVKDGANTCFYKISSNDENANNQNSSSFYLYLLNHDDVKIEEAYTTDSKHQSAGVWMTISVPTELICVSGSIKYYYIRFRLYLVDVTNLAFQTSISNDLIQAAFSKLDMYDVRINDLSNIDKEIKNTILKDRQVFLPIYKAHIFYISSPRTSLKDVSPVPTDIRIIEPEIWKSYQPGAGALGEEHMIAYHWRMSYVRHYLFKPGYEEPREPLSKINLFFTAQYPKIVFSTMCCYFAIIILLGGLGSWLVSWGTTSVSGQVIDWVWIAKIGILSILVLGIAGYGIVRYFEFRSPVFWKYH